MYSVHREESRVGSLAPNSCAVAPLSVRVLWAPEFKFVLCNTNTHDVPFVGDQSHHKHGPRAVPTAGQPLEDGDADASANDAADGAAGVAIADRRPSAPAGSVLVPSPEGSSLPSGSGDAVLAAYSAGGRRGRGERLEAGESGEAGRRRRRGGGGGQRTRTRRAPRRMPRAKRATPGGLDRASRRRSRRGRLSEDHGAS